MNREVFCDCCGRGCGVLTPEGDVWCSCGCEGIPVDPEAWFGEVRFWLGDEADEWLRCMIKEREAAKAASLLP